MKLRQVLINLVGNAVKFTTAGRVTLQAVPLGADAIQFSVSDTGPGIDRSEMARLFQPFSQTATGRLKQGGTGLGLALSSQFVRLMGGELTADSTLGQGSCFTFTLTLPPAAVAEARDPVPLPPILGLEPGQPVCRLLIVDDLADNRAPLRALLASLNPQPPVLEFREAANGEEAVALWESWQPHVILMDMRMPVLSGEEATRQIKARMAARPETVRSVVVALSASAFNGNRDHFLACGCDEFTGKPFRAEELFAILERRAGLRFTRAGAVPTADAPLSLDEVAARLASCPAAWRADLRSAVALGDFERITDLLAQLGETDAALHAALAQSAYNYDLEAFAALFSPAEARGLTPAASTSGSPGCRWRCRLAGGGPVGRDAGPGPNRPPRQSSFPPTAPARPPDGAQFVNPVRPAGLNPRNSTMQRLPITLLAVISLAGCGGMPADTTQNPGGGSASADDQAKIDATLDRLGKVCKDKLATKFPGVPMSDLRVTPGATLKESLDSGAMSLKDLRQYGATYNWQVPSKKASGDCDVDGKGKITQFTGK
jgi:CheY-like chemotaxis protein